MHFNPQKLKKLLTSILLIATLISHAQTKIKGKVLDKLGEPIPYCNVIFKESIEGVITDENGNFYLESTKTWKELEVSFIGFKTLTVTLDKKINFDLKLILEEETESLEEVVIITGKQPKKNNPAIAILRKIWERKRLNGLKQFNQYEYKKYEKVEFDLNTIDDKFKNRKVFKGMEFIFDDIDTSNVTGKTYLPIFLNESLYEVHGDNVTKDKKEVMLANQNSGFKGNEQLISYLEDLYSQYNIYNNHLKFFDKSFASPLSRTGINNYNYVLSDSSFIDNKWCYNIIYYPRRKNELTFKGDFWVNDSTFAIKEINLTVSKSANINWVKDIYIEQEFDILNDSVFVLKRDYFMSDFSLQKKGKSKGIYGKKTTVYKDYVFDKPLSDKKFFSKKVYTVDNSIYEKDQKFWSENRPEKLNKDEQKVYQLLDTLGTVKKYTGFRKAISILASGYVEIDKWDLDIGNIYQTIGFNNVEGLRLQTGFRTFKSYNDLFRIQAYGAYGFADNKFKYGFQGKWLIEPKNRLVVFAGNRQDIEQMGASLTGSVNVLGRSEGSSSIISTGVNDKLTSITLTSFGFGIEPFANLPMKVTTSYKTLKSASDTFSLDYNDPNSPTGISSDIKQLETSFALGYYPKRKKSGYGVERKDANSDFARYFAKITRGTSGIFESDFDYTKIQFSFFNLWKIGSLGRLSSTFETGQTFGEVPLTLLSIAPGNQTYYMFYNTFNQLDFYEFVTDKYAAIHLEHNFNGRIISRIPILKKSGLRTVIGFKAFIGSISDENIALNTTGNLYETALFAPNSTPYYEYSAGIANIFKVLNINFNFRGNYFDNTPNVRKFGITAAFDFKF